MLPLRNALRAVRAVMSEVVFWSLVLGGWALLTWGVARLTSVDAWIFSGGILLLSFTGWRTLFDLFWDGLHVLVGLRSDDA